MIKNRKSFKTIGLEVEIKNNKTKNGVNNKPKPKIKPNIYPKANRKFCTWI